MSRALQDVVVLDMTSSFWASFGATLLADAGARVIRVEDLSCPHPDEAFFASESWPHLYELANRNKVSVALQLGSDAGRAVFDQLVAKADVVVTDGLQPVLRERGLDYETLVRLKPDLVYAHGSSFGPDGPDRDLPALDELAAARTGMMPILPQPGQPPVYTGSGQMYSTIMLAFGVMVALWHRAETGEGQEVDASLFAGNMYGASLDLQAFLAMGGERFLQPVARLDAGNPMSGTLYPTQDGLWVTLTMPDTDRWWPQLAEITDLDAADDRFDSHEKRCEVNRLLLIDLLEQAFHRMPAAYWRGLFGERQLSADVIEDYAFPVQDEQVFRNRFILDLEHASRGPVRTLGFPLFMSDSPHRLQRTAPLRGQHSAEVLSDLLDYAEDDIVRLEAGGVVGGRR
jgi:crotonobetainyl-CoA:carnitine CoA-transferase CaiB-like acyl-CoA transferase